MVIHTLIIQMISKKTNISDELYQYAINIGVREHHILKDLRNETAKLKNATMQISQEQGQLMHLLAKITQAKRYLEIGVFTGYSSLVMALAMGDDSEVLALDNNDEYLEIARKFWSTAGVSKQITTILDNAIKSCEYLVKDGQINSFDIAFIDANKKEYLAYYEYCYQLVKPGGIILIDNVLFHGLVIEKNPPEFVKSIQKLNKVIYDDPRVEISLLPIADGLTIVYKKECL